MNAIQNCPIPVITAVDGLAAAAGCQLVAASDIAICTNRSHFSTPGFVRFLDLYFLFVQLRYLKF